MNSLSLVFMRIQKPLEIIFQLPPQGFASHGFTASSLAIKNMFGHEHFIEKYKKILNVIMTIGILHWVKVKCVNAKTHLCHLLIM